VSTSLVMNNAKIFEPDPTFPPSLASQESHRDEKWRTSLPRYRFLGRPRQMEGPLKLMTLHQLRVRFPHPLRLDTCLTAPRITSGRLLIKLPTTHKQMCKLQYSRNRPGEATQTLRKVPDSPLLLSRLPEEGLETAQKDLPHGCTALCAERKFETSCAEGTEEGGA
jgi:hypothetical protein